MGKLKWLMVTGYIHKALIENEDCLRTGLYAWIPTFDGDIKYFTQIEPKDFEKYDIIHVNCSGQDIHTLGEIRKAIGNSSSTKLVANNDYTVELWTSSFNYLPTLAREINYADMIFGTEPNQVGTLQTLLKRKVHLITHPCFTRRLKTLRPKRKLNTISTISHRYDNYNIIPSLAVKDLGCKTRLIGYDPNSDRKKFVTSMCYNEVLGGANFMDFCDQLMESRVVVDPFTLTSQSRTGWDCAALGVPLVGSDRTYSTQICYPKTCVPPFNIQKMREMVKRLLHDDKFKDEIVEEAKEKVDMVSYENSKKRYLEKLEEGSPEIKI